MKVPIRIIEGKKGESINPQKGMNFGLFKQSLKRVGRILLILAFLSSQVYLASAFEAHIVNVTARICDFSETRTMGYWKNHPNVYNPNCLPQTLGGAEVNSTTTVNEIFDNANADIMSDMLKAQLLAMKFNICAFGIDSYEGEEFGGVVLSDLVEWADNLLRDPNSTREEQKLVKDFLDHANNLHQIRYCSTEPSWLAAALAEKPKEDKKPKDRDLTESLQAILGEDESLDGDQDEPPADEEEPIIEEATTTESTSTATTTEQEATSTEPVCEPTEEICDGVDNDCDGEVDEELTQQCGSIDIGVCQYGTQSCEVGIWSECQDLIEPSLEICNDQLDNNCDGQIDENCQIEEATTTEETATSTPE